MLGLIGRSDVQIMEEKFINGKNIRKNVYFTEIQTTENDIFMYKNV